MDTPRPTCYCCRRPQSKSATGMDVDSALQELGMLSTVTESRRQYLMEKSYGARAARTRNLSEPTQVEGEAVASRLTPPPPPRITSSPRPCSTLMKNGLSIPSTPYCSPEGSPQRPTGYQLLNLNPHYVTHVSLPPPDNAAKYSGEYLNRDIETNRLSRVKLSRLKRCSKPYQVPWRHSTDGCIGAQSSPDMASSTAAPPVPTSSNNVAYVRSKSLDELDFAKLRLAQTENASTTSPEGKEVESVSRHLRRLQVHE